MRMIKYLTLILLGFISSGCATILNPYNEEFSCPETYNGKCVSITEAYEESSSGETRQPAKDIKPKQPVNGFDCDYDFEEDCYEPTVPKKPHTENNQETLADPQMQEPRTAEEEYRQALYGKLSRLLKEPTAPMVAQPKVMRVLVLPYKGDDNALYMYRYVYIFTEPPRWILDEIQIKGIE